MLHVFCVHGRSELTVPPRAGGRIAAVDFSVAIQATASQQSSIRIKRACSTFDGTECSSVPVVRRTRIMALIAEHRNRQREQRLIVRTMRQVAVQALIALAHRWVFPQERTALFLVAIEAG